MFLVNHFRSFWRRGWLIAILLVPIALVACGGGGGGGDDDDDDNDDNDAAGEIQGQALVPPALSSNFEVPASLWARLAELVIPTAEAVPGALPFTSATCIINSIGADGTLTPVSTITAATTDSNGQFSLAGVPDGDYIIECTRDPVTLFCFAVVENGQAEDVSCDAESTLTWGMMQDKLAAGTEDWAIDDCGFDDYEDIDAYLETLFDSGQEAFLSTEQINDALIDDAEFETVTAQLGANESVGSLVDNCGFADDAETDLCTPSNLAAAVPGACVAAGKIVFISDADDFRGEVYLADSDGTVTHRLTDDEARDTNPHFSPDGCKVIYTTDGSGSKDIHVLDLTTGTHTNLTSTYTKSDGVTSSDEDWGHFSPAGTQVVFQSNRSGNNDIWIASASDGSSATNLTSDNECSDVDPDWSQDYDDPDGAGAETAQNPTQKIAYARSNDGDANTTGCQDTLTGVGDIETEVVIMNTDGSSKTLVDSEAGNPMRQPDFGEGSAKLAYWLGPDPGEIKEKTFDATWTAGGRIDHTPFPDCSHPSYIPDTTEIVYESNSPPITISRVTACGVGSSFSGCAFVDLITLGCNSFDPDVMKE